MRLKQRQRLQEIIIAIEADAMVLGTEARELGRKSTGRLRKFLEDFDTIPAPAASSSSVPPGETHA